MENLTQKYTDKQYCTSTNLPVDYLGLAAIAKTEQIVHACSINELSTNSDHGFMEKTRNEWNFSCDITHFEKLPSLHNENLY